MRKLRRLLRLHQERVSAREIGRRLGVVRSTIHDNLKRATAAGLAWALGDEVTDDALELHLFWRAGITTVQRRQVEPDWAAHRARSRSSIAGVRHGYLRHLAAVIEPQPEVSK